MVTIGTSWLLESLPYSQGPCRWRLENTCPCTPKQTPKRQISISKRKELGRDDEAEHRELAQIYVARGLDPSLAKQVAEQLMAHDALGAHAHDELGISEALAARPVQAALSSAASFAVGAMLPLLAVILAPRTLLIPVVAAASLLFLGALGAWAASAGGAGVIKGATRVTFWGALAMAVTTGAGALFGSAP